MEYKFKSCPLSQVQLDDDLQIMSCVFLMHGFVASYVQVFCLLALISVHQNDLLMQFWEGAKLTANK